MLGPQAWLRSSGVAHAVQGRLYVARHVRECVAGLTRLVARLCIDHAGGTFDACTVFTGPRYHARTNFPR